MPPSVLQEQWCCTTHSSKDLSRFQSCLNSFLGQESCKSPTGNEMIFHSNLAAAGFKQNNGGWGGWRARKVISFLPQGSFGLFGNTEKNGKELPEYYNIFNISKIS